MKLKSTAAVAPPLSLPMKVQLERLWGTPHNRSNWLFAGHDLAAQRTATLYTLVASAERHGLDPQRYLTGVLAHIASTSTSQLEQFLPDRWNRATVE